MSLFYTLPNWAIHNVTLYGNLSFLGLHILVIFPKSLNLSHVLKKRFFSDNKLL